jgi:mannose-6-phosphate isomerase-like protein (cupin superfamily)
MKIDKPWGYEEIIYEGKYVVKLIHINKGCRLSLQEHKKKTETIYALGTCSVWCDSKVITITPGGYMTIPKTTIHRFAAPVNEDTTLLEISTPHLADVVRYEDDYGRVRR